MVKIIASIISHGTEKFQNKGYMAISEKINGKQYLLDCDHEVLIANIDSHTLTIKGNYSLENITISRFEMIFELLLKRINIKDNILITGFGSLALSTYLVLKEHGFKKIKIHSRNLKYKKLKNAEISNKYNVYVDTTGDSIVLKQIFEKCNTNSIIILLGTPRQQKYFIDPLLIHRKNLSIYGGHEINGYNSVERNKIFNELLKRNSSKDFSSLVSKHIYKQGIIQDLRKKKTNYYDIVMYE